MIPVPKPRFFERKVPAGHSEDTYFDVITARQTHVLRDAIDRVSFLKTIQYGLYTVSFLYFSWILFPDSATMVNL